MSVTTARPVARTARRLGPLAGIALLTLGLPVLTGGPARAATLSVPGDFETIQAALDAAAPGDTVRVDPGRYAENLDFDGKDVRLESTTGAAETVLAPPVAGTSGVEIGPAGALVGFTVTGASATFGGAVSVSGVGTLIQRNVFDGNTAAVGGSGAAIDAFVASPVIDRNVFRNNSCDTQLHAAVMSFFNDASPVITNNLVADNPCRAISLILPEGPSPQVVNNTIVRNRVGVHVGTNVRSDAQTIRNNVFVGNEVGVDFDGGTADDLPAFDHNDVFGNDVDYTGDVDLTGQDGNVSVDPHLAGTDHRLSPGSPLVDAGSVTGAPADDLDGDPRPVDGDGDGTAGIDIGADELTADPTRTVTIDVRPGRDDNRISLRSRTPLRVAVLSGPDLAPVRDVDRTSLTFGRTGTEASLVDCNRAGQDLNRDRVPDLVCRFDIAATGLTTADTEVNLAGSTRDGQPFTASAPVVVTR